MSTLRRHLVNRYHCFERGVRDALAVRVLDICVLWSTGHDCWLSHVFDMLSQTFRSDSSLLSEDVAGEMRD